MHTIEYHCGDRFGWRAGTRRFSTSNAAFDELRAIQRAERRCGVTPILMRVGRA